MEDYLQLPMDITEVSSKELGRFFNTFTKQKMWTRTLVGMTSVTLKDLEQKLDTIRVKVYRDLPPKMSVKEKELHAQGDERARQTVRDITEFEGKLLLLENYLENLSDGIFSISREISRREADWGEEERLENVDSRRKRNV